MCLANFMCAQDIIYTFENCGLKSYMDHVLIPEYMCDMIINCEIIHDECNNLSDHPPVYIKMAIPIKGEHGTDDCNRKRYPRFPHPRWKDPLFIKLYRKNI